MKSIFAILILILTAGGFSLPEVSRDQPERGEWDFSLQRIWRLDEAAGAPFGEIQRIIIPTEGRVVIQDQKQYRLYVVDGETGRVLHAFGKQGEGPGEIRRMQGVLSFPGGLVVPERGRLHFFDMSGAFKRSEIIPPEIVPRAFIDEDTIVSAPVLPREDGEGNETVSIFRISTKKTRPIATYKAFAEGKASENSGGNVMTIGIVVGGLTPMMEISVHDGIIYYGRNDLYRISRVTLDGRENPPFGISGRDRAPVSMKYKKSIFDGIGADIPPRMLEKILNGLPDQCTAWSRMVVDSRGMIHVIGADLEKTNQVGMDLFSPDGKYLYHGVFSVPAGETIQAMALKDQRLVLAVEDEDGELRVEGFRISLPPM